jgi:hypothetical protein
MVKDEIMIAGGKLQNSGKSLLQRHFVDTESHLKSPDTEPVCATRSLSTAAWTQPSSVATEDVWLEVLTAVTMKMAVFWVVAPCWVVWVYRRFRSLYCLHHQSDDIHSHSPENLKSYLVYLYGEATDCFAISSPWWWKQYRPLKRRWTHTSLHGATTQKRAIFIL